MKKIKPTYTANFASVSIDAITQPVCPQCNYEAPWYEIALGQCRNCGYQAAEDS